MNRLNIIFFYILSFSFFLLIGVWSRKKIIFYEWNNKLVDQSIGTVMNTILTTRQNGRSIEYLVPLDAGHYSGTLPFIIIFFIIGLTNTLSSSSSSYVLTETVHLIANVKPLDTWENGHLFSNTHFGTREFIIEIFVVDAVLQMTLNWIVMSLCRMVGYKAYDSKSK